MDYLLSSPKDSFNALCDYIYIYILFVNLLLENLFPRVKCKKRNSREEKKERGFIYISSNEIKPSKQTTKKNKKLAK